MDTELQRRARAAWLKLSPSDRHSISLKRFTDSVNEQFSSSYDPVDVIPIFEELLKDESR